MSFEILDAGSPRWAALFDALPRVAQDVFYAPGFASLCQATLNAGQRVQCAAYAAESGALLLYPFVLRDVDRLAPAAGAEGLADTVSLYGRGGVVGAAEAQELSVFHAELSRYCARQRVFCSFDRFHPVMGNERFSPAPTQLREVGGFVVVRLRPTMEELEASFKSSVRKDLRKAERNGVRCYAEANCDHLADFLEIYYQTMERNAASDFYYFPEAFFAGLPQHLPGQFHFFYAEHEGKVVSCELVLHHADYSHSFLGGTRRESLPLAANPLLKRHICESMMTLGCKYFLLGGGQTAGDGIFNFKKAYAPDGVLPSYVGGTVWNVEPYEALRTSLLAAGRPIAANRFQFYDAS